MKKIILVLSLVLLALVGCSKSEDAILAGVSSNLLKRIENSSETLDGNSTTNVAYNGNKIIEFSSSRNGILSKTIFTYNGDLIIKRESLSNGILNASEEYIYENGKLTTTFSMYSNTSQSGIIVFIKSKKVYTYNANGTVLETNFKFVDNAYVTANSTKLYTIFNGNVTKLIGNSSSSSTYYNGTATVTDIYTSTYTNNYEYDSKNNPLKNILGWSKISFDSNNSINNLLKETGLSESTTNGVANPAVPERVREYTLMYNSNDYPTLIKYLTTTSTVNNNGVITTVVKTNTTNYFYE